MDFLDIVYFQSLYLLQTMMANPANELRYCISASTAAIATGNLEIIMKMIIIIPDHAITCASLHNDEYEWRTHCVTMYEDFSVVTE